MRFGPSRTLALVAVLSLTLVACDGTANPDEAGENPDGTAAALVEGLSAGVGEEGEPPDLSALEFSDAEPDQVARQYAAIIEGLGVRPEVILTEVKEDGDTAEVELEWRWPLTPERDWRYESDVQLTRAGDTWQVVWRPDVVEDSLEPKEVLTTTTIRAARGDIVGQGGAKIVRMRSVVNVGVDKTGLSQAQATRAARAVAALAEVEVQPFVQRVRASGDLAFVNAITYRTEELPDAIATGHDEIEGARLVATRLPLAPTREFAAPILGRVGDVTAEMVEEDPDTYQPGDQAGISGLQATYDDDLRGVDGVVIEAVKEGASTSSTNGVREREVARISQRKPKPLRLTLDVGLQEAAEATLADVGPQSSLVAIRPSDGAILAAANGPGNNGQNFATSGQYAPGSTFKAVSALALLRAGLTPTLPVECTATINVDGRSFKNYDDYPSSRLGRISLRSAVAQSCNTALIAQRDEVGRAGLSNAAAALGLTTEHDLGFPAYFGQVRPAEGDTEAAANMIGQGTVLASPMAMATVIASIRRGETVVPHLVSGVTSTAPSDIDALTGQEAEQLRGMLGAVVSEGTGTLLGDVPGPPIIAKTGTAEYQTEGGEIDTHGWMIAAQGDLALAVFVGANASGSGVAGPLMERFLRAAG